MKSELRHSVQNASYENKDPLLIYKLESYNLFKNMVDMMNRKTAAVLMRGQIPVREEPTEEEKQAMAAVKQLWKRLPVSVSLSKELKPSATRT